MIQTAKIKAFATSRYGIIVAMLIAAILLILILIQIYSTLGLFIFSPNLNSHPSKLSSIHLDLHPHPHSLTHTQTITHKHAIADWHLFGVYQSKALNPKTLPKSMLNLKLLGVFISTHNPSHLSKAVITVPGGAQHVYRVGDALAPGAKLYRILSDNVIIQREGELETLQLPQKKIIFDQKPTPLTLDQTENEQ